MVATDIMRDITRLPVSQRMLVAEHIIRSVRREEKQSLDKAAEHLYADYLTDKNLTAFTQLDCEQFYEAR